MQDKMPLTWNETLTLSLVNSSEDTEVIVELKHRSSLRTKTCVGSAVTSLKSLLSKSDSGEVPLNLFHAVQAGLSTGIGTLFVRLRQIGDIKKARLEIGITAKDVQQRGIDHTSTSAKFGAREEAAAQVNALASSLVNILDKLDIFVGLMDKLTTVHPYLNMAWQVVSSLYRAVRGQIKTDEKVVGLVNTMEEIFSSISDIESIRNKINSLESPIKLFLRQSSECCLFIQQYIQPGFIGRMANVMSSQKVDEFSKRFEELKEALHSGIVRNTTVISARISERVDTIFLREELKPFEMYASNRKQCLHGTRTQLLEEIMDWLFSDANENILWLHGVAGAGKSAISMTIAEYCLDMCCRGAYLFFEREKSDPGSVIRTIAFWLASFDQSISEHVIKAVRGHNGIAGASITMQFDKLLYGPLCAAAGATNGPVIVILDALDECGTRDGREALLSLLGKEIPKLPRNFRFLVTSRPETDIRKALSSSSVHKIELDCSLQSSRDDVRQCIDHKMRIIFEGKTLPPEMDKNIQLLSNTAKGLFVWASTAIKLVSASNFPSRELQLLVSYCRSDDRASRWNSESGLNDLYCSVLDRSEIRRDSWTKLCFKQVLGLILLSKIPLSVAAIDGILGFTEESSSSNIIERLPSVLEYRPEEPDEPVRLFHASFSDYLRSRQRDDDPWFIDVARQRDFIAMRCFDVMGKGLRFNICDLASSVVRNDDVPDIQTLIKDKIPPHLEYVCRFWAEHLLDVPYSSASHELPKKLEAFAGRHLLYWFEVLSLTKHFRHLAGRALLDATIWSASNMSKISSFLWYIYRLANTFSLPISESVAHIYLSALSFAAGESKIASEYAKQHPVIQVQTFGTKSRQPCLKTFTGHTGDVRSVAFSPDGKRIVSGSDDETIRVLDTETGEVISGPFTGHECWVSSVAFSPDGKLIVSGSGDKTIRVWDAETGEVVSGPFTGHTDSVSSVAYSPDGKQIASGSDDETIRVWDTETGEVISGPFTGHECWVSSVAFSPDGKLIVSGSGDKTIRVWDAETGEVVSGPFTGHTDYVYCVAFSPDGKRIVSGSDDRTIRVWDVETGEVISSPFTGHTGRVWSVAFSLDGKRIVSGSYDKMIRVWDAETGEAVSGPFTGHTHFVCSVVFSPEGKRIVSGSADRTIRVWDAEAGKIVSGPFTRYTSWDGPVSSSLDRTCKASVSSEGSIRICSIEDGPVVQLVGTNSSASADGKAGRTRSSLHVGLSEDRATASILRDVGIGESWTMSKDGWILGKGGELLMWIPPDLRETLWQPSNTAVLNCEFSTRLDFTDCRIGLGWDKECDGW